MFSGRDWPIVIFDWYLVVVIMLMMVDFLLVVITKTEMCYKVF